MRPVKICFFFFARFFLFLALKVNLDRRINGRKLKCVLWYLWVVNSFIIEVDLFKMAQVRLGGVLRKPKRELKKNFEMFIKF